MVFAEDLDAFLGDFAIAATLNGAAVKVIFDQEYIEPLNLVQSTNPHCLVKSSVGAAVDDALVADGISYTVISVQPDGTGMDLLELNR